MMRLTKLAASGGVEQAGFVVVGIGGQEGIARGQIEEGLVAFEFLVAEEAEGGVASAVALDNGGGALAEHEPFLLETIALGNEGLFGAGGVVQLAEAFVDGPEVALHGGELVAKGDDHFPLFEVVLATAHFVPLDPAFRGVHGVFEGVHEDELGDLELLVRRNDGETGGLECGSGGGGEVAAGAEADDGASGEAAGQRVGGQLDVLLGALADFLPSLVGELRPLQGFLGLKEVLLIIVDFVGDSPRSHRSDGWPCPNRSWLLVNRSGPDAAACGP